VWRKLGSFVILVTLEAVAGSLVPHIGCACPRVAQTAGDIVNAAAWGVLRRPDTRRVAVNFIIPDGFRGGIEVRNPTKLDSGDLPERLTIVVSADGYGTGEHSKWLFNETLSPIECRTVSGELIPGPNTGLADGSHDEVAFWVGMSQLGDSNRLESAWFFVGTQDQFNLWSSHLGPYFDSDGRRGHVAKN